MSLRAEDLKPGDVVRIDLHVHYVYETGLHLVTDNDSLFIKYEQLAGVNAERVQRPRPVRKGDALWCGKHDAAITFIAILDGNAVGYWPDDNALAWIRKDDVCHMDNAAIDWEASE